MTQAVAMRHSAPLARQVSLVASRSIRRVLRSPGSLFPPLVMPLLLLTINSAGLAKVTEIPGFPQGLHSYADFALTFTFMQGALFCTVIAGLSLGQDIEAGFLDRLALTPLNGAALIVGQVAGAAVVALAAACIYVGVGLLAFDVRFQSGVVGVVMLLALAVATAIAFATLGSFIALRAGSAEAVQGLFPLMFAALFLSTVNMPLNLITVGWFHAIAHYNPVSYMVEGIRSLIITNWDSAALARDFATLAVLLTIGIFGCSWALRKRLTRT